MWKRTMRRAGMISIVTLGLCALVVSGPAEAQLRQCVCVTRVEPIYFLGIKVGERTVTECFF